MASDSLTITDNRTGKIYEVPIRYGTFPLYGASIRGADLKNIKVSDEDFGLMSFDPAFLNSASCKSAITFIDGERGILRYRGTPSSNSPSRATTWRWRTSWCTANCRPRRSTTCGRGKSPSTPWSTRISSGSSTAFTTTPTRCRC